MFFIARRWLFAAASLLILSAISASSIMAQSVPAAGVAVYVPLVLKGPQATPAEAIAQRVVELTNQERQKNGCAPLALSSKLMAAAMRHSTDMALNDRFSHTGSDGSTLKTRIDDANYDYFLIAENIAVGQSTAEDVVAAWMTSSAHRANMLNCELKEIGVGFYDEPDDQPNVVDDSNEQSGPYRFYWTQDFGQPR